MSILEFCNFKNLARYPFDEEDCEIVIGMNEPFTKSIRLISQLVDNGPSMFSQYYIKNWTIENDENDSKFIIAIKLHLQRNVLMILLVVYVPTFMVTVINQAMNYLSNKVGPDGNVGDFGNTIKVNVSCMIVLAMIYNSVSASLVSTPHVKMVEIWLLSSLAYAFTCILVNIRLHLIQNDVVLCHRTGSNINVKSIVVEDTENSGKVEADSHLTNSSEGSYSSHHMEATCLKFITFYVLPIVYTIFMIMYFTLIKTLYYA